MHFLGAGGDFLRNEFVFKNKLLDKTNVTLDISKRAL